MHHRGKWKRRRQHTVPVFHRTIHRYSWERSMRHEASGNALSGLRCITGLIVGGLLFLCGIAVVGGLLSAVADFLRRIFTRGD